MAPLASPLAPSVIPRLLPEFVDYWNQELADKPGLHELPWDPEVRRNPPLQGGSDPLPVGAVKDYEFRKFCIRVFTPAGRSPIEGWPVMVYFHGGGWTLGNINTENAIASHFCKRANLVVVALDYRLAPENPFPAAFEDAVDAFTWVYEQGGSILNINVSRFALGGSSSGANLAAGVAHHAAGQKPPIPLTFQYLNVPVVDNTTSLDPLPAGTPHPYPSWLENADAPSLTPAKMIWYKNNYLPRSSPTYEQDLVDWRSSPIYAPDALFEHSPKHTFIGICEIDVLRDEGLAYAEKLRRLGGEDIDVRVKVYKGAPHPVMALDKKLKVGRECIDDAVEAAIAAFSS